MSITTFAVGIIALLVGGFAGAGIADIPLKEMGQGPGRNSIEDVYTPNMPSPIDYVSMRPEVTALPVETLTQEERDSLVYMREEEKLARDVYTKLYEQWNTPIFSNIAQSEQTHTEAVRDLLTKYNIPDPVFDDAIGVFADKDLKTLYDTLVAQGSKSLTDALTVGATIEDLDLSDLKRYLSQVDNKDITFVYENLMRGSRNHLRAFTRQLSAQGGSYDPQHITAEEYTTIISAEQETGYGSGGVGRAGGRGWGNR